jgi:SAM-dependent methyltransferase
MISLFRKYQYSELSKLRLDGSILDMGGSRKSGYHDLVRGNHKFTVVNLNENNGYDFKFDLENAFPVSNETYDNAIGINVFEHIFNYDRFLAESYRILKKNGKLILTSPFLFQIHGQSDGYNDYNRFTQSALEKIFKKHNFIIELIKPLGLGIFSVIYQLLLGVLPSKILKLTFQKICVFLDLILIKVCPMYKKTASNYPIGYFIVLRK